MAENIQNEASKIPTKKKGINVPSPAARTNNPTGRPGGVLNYTSKNIEALLDVIDELKPQPISEGWDEVAKLYNTTKNGGGDGGCKRTADSLKRKFLSVANSAPTGDGSKHDELIERAQKTSKALLESVNAKVVGLPKDEEEAVERHPMLKKTKTKSTKKFEQETHVFFQEFGAILKDAINGPDTNTTIESDLAKLKAEMKDEITHAVNQAVTQITERQNEQFTQIMQALKKKK